MYQWLLRGNSLALSQSILEIEQLLTFLQLVLHIHVYHTFFYPAQPAVLPLSNLVERFQLSQSVRIKHLHLVIESIVPLSEFIEPNHQRLSSINKALVELVYRRHPLSPLVQA